DVGDKRTVWSIKEARQRVEAMIGEWSGEWLALSKYFEQYLASPDLARTAVASSFGATLEMAREGLVEISQAGPFAPIYVRKREDGAAWQAFGAGGRWGGRLREKKGRDRVAPKPTVPAS